MDNSLDGKTVMMHFEYKVIPAPAKGAKAKGIRGPEARFAHTLQETLNQLASEGWEYLRAETLPSEERHGLTSVTTTFRNVLVFRRTVQDEQAAVPSASQDTDREDAPGPQTGDETDSGQDHRSDRKA